MPKRIHYTPYRYAGSKSNAYQVMKMRHVATL